MGEIDLARYALALVGVVLLMLAVAWIAARLGWAQRLPRKGSGRLEAVESLTLDSRHRVVLLRHDGTEHLLVLGGNNPLRLDSHTPDVTSGSDEP